MCSFTSNGEEKEFERKGQQILQQKRMTSRNFQEDF